MNKARWRQRVNDYIWPIIAGLLLAALVIQYQQAPAPIATTQHVTGNTTLTRVNGTATSYADAVALASPSVVNIYTSRVVRQQRHPLMNDPLFRRFFEAPEQDTVAESLGSGVIASSDGHVLTNNHVIKNADKILVRTADGRQQLAAVIGTDPETDLAVLKVDLENLIPAQFADSNQLRVGDVVLAIGNPYGFRQSVSQGIVSATGRYGLRLNTYENFIQTDAATNPGNSGGALVNTSGQVVGINTAIYSKSGGSHGIALAIPTDIANHVLRDIIEFGEVIRGWLGIQVQELTPSLRKHFGLTGIEGVVLTGTYRNGPADRAGLRPGDIITHIADIQTGSGNSGMHQIAMIRPGNKINIRVIREGAAQSFWVEVGKRQSQSSE